MESNHKNSSLNEKAQHTRKTSAGWMIKMIGRIMDNAMKEKLAPHGISIHQFILIMSLAENEGVTQNVLGEITELPSYAVSRNLDALGSLNYVKRSPNENSRRSFNISLTAEGRALLPKLFQAVGSVNNQVLEPLSSNEKEELTKLLEKLM